jgi:hypothetical protein
MTLQIQGDSAEAIAYALLLGIATKEGKAVVAGIINEDKQWLFSTYQECLRAVKLMPPKSAEELLDLPDGEEAKKTTAAANTGQPEPRTETVEPKPAEDAPPRRIGVAEQLELQQRLGQRET